MADKGQGTKGGGAKAPSSKGGKSSKGSRTNCTMNSKLPSHFRGQVQGGQVDVKGKWTNWTDGKEAFDA